MSDWVVELGFAAQQDLQRFPWDPDVEVGGCVMGRFECSGINRRDTGRHVFVRRVFASDYGGDSTSVRIDSDSLHHLQTIPVPNWRGRPSGRFGADDPGVIVGCIHSHPGIERQRELSDTDIWSAAENAPHAPALRGKPTLSVLATAGESWEAGEPIEDWDNPVLDYFLVFGDRSIIRPTVTYMSEVEWLCEEGQRALSAHANEGGN